MTSLKEKCGMEVHGGITILLVASKNKVRAFLHCQNCTLSNEFVLC